MSPDGLWLPGHERFELRASLVQILLLDVDSGQLNVRLETGGVYRDGVLQRGNKVLHLER